MKYWTFLSFAAFSFVLFSCQNESSSEESGDDSIAEVEEDVVTPMINAIFVHDADTLTPEDVAQRSGSDVKLILQGIDDGTMFMLSDKNLVANDGFTELIELELTQHESNVTQPFRVTVRHKVKDYETWKWLYNANEKSRVNAGLELMQFGTVKGDPNDIYIMYAIPDIAKAREMMNNPNLKKKMVQSGVIGEPQIIFWRPYY